MANLFKALKPTADLGHSGFDLSQKHVFSSKSGLADPVCPIECVPSDHIQINVASLHRTMTMNTAAFLRGKFRYDTFFVPYTQLWHNFNQFIDQRQDKHSSVLRSFEYVPVFNMGNLLRIALHSFRRFHWDTANVVECDCDIYGVPFIFGLVRNLDMLGYGNYQPLLIPTESLNPATGNPWQGTERTDAFQQALLYAQQFDNKYCNFFRIAAYNHIWYDYYRNKYYDEKKTFIGSSQELDYIQTFNFDDLYCDTFSNSQLNIPQLSYSASVDIWHDNIEVLRVFAIFGSKYVQWKKDLFTSSMPGTQFGSISTVDISFTSPLSITGSASLAGNTGSDFDRWSTSNPSYEFPKGTDVLTSNVGNSLYSGDNHIVHTHALSGSATISSQASLSGSTAFDVLALKRAEALQAWKENTLRAGNMVDSNFRAHYGVEPRFEGDNNVVYLGSNEAILEVNSVTANADTAGLVNGRVGDLAATGTAVLKGDTIKYDCKDFGVILTISSFVPESEYSNNMIDKANRLYEKFDFFTPEYQNIGLESVAGVDLDINLFSNEPNKVLGYAPRYWMYKCAIDKVHGEFSRTPYMQQNQPVLTIDGTLRAWVAPRIEYLVYGGFDEDGYHKKSRALATFYCSPTVLDTIFGLTNVNDLNDLGRQRTDCFLNNVYFDVKAIRPMSVLGLPKF